MINANEPMNATDPERPSNTATPMTRWQKFRLLVRVVELRLRFILLMAITGMVFAYWDSIWNHVDKWMRPQASKVVAKSGYEFYCAMHPNVVQDQPGSCPICGMPLTRRKKGQQEVLPEGVLARVQLAPFRIEQAGIRTAEVAFAPLTETVTTVGYIVHDETRYSVIASKIKGMTRIEQLYVNYLGMPVKAGQPLAVIYNPELYVATQELLLAQRRAQEPPRPQSPTGRSLLSDSKDVFEASVEKFKLWGISQTQIDEILKQGKAQYQMPILAPMSGHVTKKNVVAGQMVPEGYDLFEIADLNDVWVKAQVYEDQIPLVRVGQAVEATVASFPGDVFPGRVAFIDPELDPATRTIGVRYDLANPGHRLRPGMFATVTLRTPMADMPAFQARAEAAGSVGKSLTRLAGLTVEEQKICPVTGLKLGVMGAPVPVETEGGKIWTCCAACPPKLQARPAKYLARLAPPPKDEVLSVPESAVIDTGTHKVVYVETEPGVFEGREVVLGPRSGDRFPVLEGLSPGEKVAAEGAFLIDAESRLHPPAVTSRKGTQ